MQTLGFFNTCSWAISQGARKLVLVCCGFSAQKARSLSRPPISLSPGSADEIPLGWTLSRLEDAAGEDKSVDVGHAADTDEVLSEDRGMAG